jgi:nucleotide-binding universal stress UspA family protein
LSPQANEREVDLVVVGSRRWQPEGRLAGALKGAVSSIIPSLGSVSKELLGQLPMSTLLVSNESLVQWEQQEIPLAASSPLTGGA